MLFSLLLALLVLTPQEADEDQVSGIVLYADGTQQRFIDLAKINGSRYDISAGIPLRRIHRLRDAKEMLLFYHNGDRWVHLSELEYVHVGKSEVTAGDVVRGTVDIRTKDGASLRYDMELSYLVNVVVRDDSTGETRILDAIPFAQGDQLKIRTVLFD
jgi:hypothetical protein